MSHSIVSNTRIIVLTFTYGRIKCREYTIKGDLKQCTHYNYIPLHSLLKLLFNLGGLQENNNHQKKQCTNECFI